MDSFDIDLNQPITSQAVDFVWEVFAQMKLTPENMPDCGAADDFYRKDLTVEEANGFYQLF
jgi:hypothetical protein